MKKLSFKPPNIDLERVLNMMIDNKTVVVKSSVSAELCKYKEFRFLREKKHIHVGDDRRNNESIMFIPYVKIKKNGDKFIFEGL